MGLKVRIITPKGLYAQLEVESLNVKLTSGYRTILKGHTPLIGALAIAPMHVTNGSNITYYAVHGGAINITQEGVSLIVNAIEEKSEIDLPRALEAKKRAEGWLNSKDENADIKRAQVALLRAITRIEIANK